MKSTITTRRLCGLPTLFTAAFCALAASAEPGGVVDENGGTYTLDKDSAYTVTEDDVTAAEGLAIVKKGSGTVTAGAVLAAFAGEIRIEEGIWLVTDGGGLGTDAGSTVVSNGAALHVNGTKDLEFLAAETVTIVGSGPDGKGAFYNAANNTQQYSLFKNRGELVLSGDATVGGKFNFGVGKGYLRMNGHTMTIAMGASATPFDMACRAIDDPGHFVVSSGRIFFDGASYDTSWGGDSSTTVTVASASQIGFRGVKTAIPYTAILENGAVLYPSNDSGNNEWGGPMRLNGMVKVSYTAKENHAMVISGPISGPGGLEVPNGEFLRLFCTTNSFEGGVSISGGARLVLSHDGALPLNGGGITCSSGTIITRNGAMTLPDITSCSACTISNSVPGSVVTIGNITKDSGSDTTLALIGGIHVTNRLDVLAGHVRFARTDGTTEPGVYSTIRDFKTEKALDEYVGWSFTSGNATDTRLGELATKLIEEGDMLPAVRPSLPYLVNTSWPSAYPLELSKGYFRNNEPTNVLVTFVTSIADIAVLWIDGSVVIKAVGSISYPRASESTYFIRRTPITLSPGLHEFKFLVGHRNSSSYGPKTKYQDFDIVGANWSTAAFGLAWRCGTEEPNANYMLGVVLQSSDYAAVDNSGESVILVRDAGCLEAEETDRWKARWLSPVAETAAFAVGTVLDLDSPQNLPFLVGNLSGTPTVSGGALCLDGTWEPTAVGLAAQPLTLDGATLSFTPDAVLAHPVANPAVPVRLAYAPAGSAISGAPSVTVAMRSAYRKCAVTDAGEGALELDLLPIPGLKFIIQ